MIVNRGRRSTPSTQQAWASWLLHFHAHLFVQGRSAAGHIVHIRIQHTDLNGPGSCARLDGDRIGIGRGRNGSTRRRARVIARNRDGRTRKSHAGDRVSDHGLPAGIHDLDMKEGSHAIAHEVRALAFGVGTAPQGYARGKQQCRQTAKASMSVQHAHALVQRLGQRPKPPLDLAACEVIHNSAPLREGTHVVVRQVVPTIEFPVLADGAVYARFTSPGRT